jgi:hypothetical protein
MNLSEAPIPMIKKRSFFKDLEEFNQYCNDFYNQYYGVYPIASSEQIEAAIGEYLTEPHPFEIQFDSIDRENVRMILEPSYSPFGPAIEFTVCEQ